jgi:hypothetical protein
MHHYPPEYLFELATQTTVARSCGAIPLEQVAFITSTMNAWQLSQEYFASDPLTRLRTIIVKAPTVIDMDSIV